MDRPTARLHLEVQKVKSCDFYKWKKDSLRTHEIEEFLLLRHLGYIITSLDSEVGGKKSSSRKRNVSVMCFQRWLTTRTSQHLCFGCHQEKLYEQEDTILVPSNIIMLGSKKNWRFLHLQRFSPQGGKPGASWWLMNLNLSQLHTASPK